jgi:RND family efflux transporter MFP subunit
MTETQAHTMTSSVRSPRRPGGLLLTLALAATAACAGGAEGAESAAETGGTDTTAATAPALTLALGPQDVAEARERELAAGVVLSGSLEPAEIVPIRAQVGGTMNAVRVDRGTPVRRGQVMATIEAAGVRSQAAGARAGVAAAEANLALARQRLDAARTLHEAGAMSDIDFRSAQSAHEAAQAQLAAAKGEAAAAGEQAGHATITAPITGVVSQRDVEPGQPVRVGDPLFTVVNSTTLELAGQIPVEQAAQVAVGEAVVFTLTGQPGQELRGTVARKDPMADPATRQVGVYVRLPNPGGRIVGGQFARGRIVGERVERAIVVPETAVRTAGDSSYVLVVEQGKAARRAVTLGARDESAGVVAVLAGVRAGEQVITAPGASVTPGAAVRVTDAAAAAPRAEAVDTVAASQE